MVGVSILPAAAGLVLNRQSITPKQSGPLSSHKFCQFFIYQSISCSSPRAQPTEAELAAILEKHAKWLSLPPDQKAKMEDELRGELCGVQLTIKNSQTSDVIEVNGREVPDLNLSQMNLSGARIEIAKPNQDLPIENSPNIRFPHLNLSAANLYCSTISGFVMAADLTDADLSEADLSGVAFKDSKLEGALFENANLANVEFGANRTLPSAESFATARNLFSLTYPIDQPESLVEIREELKKAGLRKQENEITYAVRKTSERRAGWLEWTFNYFLFDLTCQFGMSPGRPLKILWYTFWSFALVYVFAQRWPGSNGGIWAHWTSDRINHNQDKKKPERLDNGFPASDFSHTWLGNKLKCYRVSCISLALYFSVTSALRIGWRDLSLGTWIDRLLPREYTLRSTGWVNVVSGFQSMLSVYLLALWVLTYFGTPFE